MSTDLQSQRSIPRLWAGRLAPPAIVALVAMALFSQTRHYGLLGWDSYPLIISSRVQSFADFIGIFTEKLMDGRYPGDFYRPLLNLTFAADHALWGLQPVGYQLTNVLAFAGCAWAIYALARRLMGPDSNVGPLVALLVFALNPLLFEVLPAPARRPELLCCMFMALSLSMQLRPRALESRRPPLLPVVAALLAMASKESALVLPALSWLVVVLYSPREKRFAHAFWTTVPHAVALALMVAVRLAVLGGIGGHGSLSPGAALAGIPKAVFLVSGGLLLPQQHMQGSMPGQVLIAVLTLVVVGIAALQAWRQPETDARSNAASHIARAMQVAGAWILLFGLTYATVGLIGPWYMLLPVAGWAILVGALAQVLVASIADETRSVRVASVAALALLAALLLWQSRYSPLFYRYDEWNRATTMSERYFADADVVIRAAKNGTIAHSPSLPSWVTPANGAPTITGAAVLAPYSVQAWAELILPERNVRVEDAVGMILKPTKDEVLLLIESRIQGFTAPASQP